ncbi:MAG: RNA polymerase sigma factor RpoH [Methylococcales bacterium]|jgi:RNA polymerase sigma-32 factor|nr:RNA polymerase sigma factor RpoH [Methylococcales bacterium]
MTQSMSYLVPGSDSSLDAYVRAAGKISILQADEEKELAKKLKYEGDLEAAKKLVMAHLRFVIHIAKSYSGYGLALPDLIQEGNVGLMKAVKRFDPEQGVRLISFAVHWIRAEMHEFIIRNWKIVKVATTKAQRKLFFNLRSSKKRLGWFNQEEINNVAEALNVKPEVVVEMEARLSANDVTFDKPDNHQSDGLLLSPEEYVEDTTAEPLQLIERYDSVLNQQMSLKHALDQLDDRSREIVECRWLNEKKVTLTKLAERYKVSAERIRQLENKAIKQLQQSMS